MKAQNIGMVMIGAATEGVLVNISALALPEPRLVAPGLGWPRMLAVGPADTCAAFMCSSYGALSCPIVVDAALDADTARSRLARWHYDLVALLLPLTRTDEEAICRGLRVVTGRVLVLVLAADNSMERAPSPPTAGADAYLRGPLNPHNVRACLSALLRSQAAVAVRAGESRLRTATIADVARQA